MSVLFCQILLVVCALFFIVASFGEKRQVNRYADHAMTVVMFILLLATLTWKM